MNDMSSDSPLRRLRAPREDRGVLIEPSLGQAEQLFRANRQRLRTASAFISRVRRDACRHLLEQAQRHTLAYRDVSLPALSQTSHPGMILTGHQPDFFHPGVWFKNFVLHELASRVGAVPLHLVIDNDLCQTAALRVPSGSVERPKIQTLPLDRATSAPVPHEQRRVQDLDCFSSFAERVEESMGRLVASPLLCHRWHWACESTGRHDSLGTRLSRMRHKLEAAWGLETLELPLSVVCDSQPFLLFLADLIGRFEEWHSVYNRSVVDFRKRHRIRSATHPVPELVRRDRWCELPLWMWSDEDPQRRRVFVRKRAGQLEITDRNSDPVVVLGRPGDEDEVAQRLFELRAKGTKLRPRALVTTLYARLFLGDLFIHGIGGAKYDGLTDVLIGALYGVHPPAFLTVTLTLRLPIAHDHVSPDRVSELRQYLRHLKYHPDSRLEADSEKLDADTADADAADADAADKVSFWIAQKKHWISQDLPQGNRQARHDGIAAANAALATYLKAEVRAVNRELRETQERLKRQTILESREYAYCLFPEKFIQNALFDCLS